MAVGKRLLFLIIILVVLASDLLAIGCAFSSSLTDPAFLEWDEVMKDSRYSLSDMETAYRKFLSSSPEGYVRFYGTYCYGLALLDRKEKKTAKTILKELQTMEETVTDVFTKETMHLETMLLQLSLERSVSCAVEVLEKTKEYYAKWGDKDVFAVLAEAGKCSTAPAMFGGSHKKAIELYETLLPDCDTFPKEYQFSIYKGLLVSCLEKKEWEKAVLYGEQALSLFPHDGETQTALETAKKKVGKK